VILFDFLAPDCSISALLLATNSDQFFFWYGGFVDAFSGFRCDAFVVELCGADGGGFKG
jgi:hypothetical protein